jgi:hypothetical protein
MFAECLIGRLSSVGASRDIEPEEVNGFELDLCPDKRQ